MTRTILPFLCPWINRTTRSLKPEHAGAYISLQRRCTQSLASQHFTGPHDVEKQKRLDQLSKVKPLDNYHPRLVSSDGAAYRQFSAFNQKYGGINGRSDDLVSMLGMVSFPAVPHKSLITLGRVRSVRLLGSKLMFLDIERNYTRLQIMVDARKLVDQDDSDSFDNFKKVVKVGDWICELL